MAGERVESCDQVEFDVVEVADTMGWQLPLVKRGLRQLQWSSGNISLTNTQSSEQHRLFNWHLLLIKVFVCHGV